MAGAAWVARIDTIGDVGNFESVAIGVSYYDAIDIGFLTPLWQHSLTVEFGTPAGDIAAAIRKFGQTQRAVQDKIASLQAQVGTTVAVP